MTDHQSRAAGERDELAGRSLMNESLEIARKILGPSRFKRNRYGDAVLNEKSLRERARELTAEWGKNLPSIAEQRAEKEASNAE